MSSRELRSTPLLPDGFGVPVSRSSCRAVEVHVGRAQMADRELPEARYLDPDPLTFAELGELGFKFIFITLGGQHAAGYGLSTLLAAMAEREEQGYIELQRREFAAGQEIPTRSHHEFSGGPYHHLLGEAYDAARLGSAYVEALPVEKVV